MTESKREINELEQAVARERRARIKAEEENRAKSELLALTAHEIRTPMGAIISLADLLRASGLTPVQEGYAETLKQSAKTLVSILNDVLEHSKLEAGRCELNCKVFHLDEFLEQQASALKIRAAGKSIGASLAISGDASQPLYGDLGKLRQILDNLTDNALRFTDMGAIDLAVDIREGDNHRVHLRFEIIDTGVGVAEGDIDRIFELYAQSRDKRGDDRGGTGLGLSISRKLAHLMGGDIGCKINKTGGSTFWFTALAEYASKDTAVRGDAGPEDHGSLSGHVLVVEDNQVNQFLIQAFLQQFGLTSEIVANGKDAIAAVKVKCYDLVLMDVMMPAMDGIETARQIGRLEIGNEPLPIIALTASEMCNEGDISLAKSMDGYVSKPIEARDLFMVLARFLPKKDKSTVVNA